MAIAAGVRRGAGCWPMMTAQRPSDPAHASLVGPRFWPVTANILEAKAACRRRPSDLAPGQSGSTIRTSAASSTRKMRRRRSRQGAGRPPPSGLPRVASSFAASAAVILSEGVSARAQRLPSVRPVPAQIGMSVARPRRAIVGDAVGRRGRSLATKATAASAATSLATICSAFLGDAPYNLRAMSGTVLVAESGAAGAL